MFGYQFSLSLRPTTLLAGILVSVSLGPNIAAAQQSDWIVTEMSGEASQQGADGSWHPVSDGTVLVTGMPVKTGPHGRLIIAHQNDRLTVSPGSEFEIPKNANPASDPSILQRLGTLLFKVEHTPDRRFEVKTPYLAAVVKGTVFTVSVGGASDAVHVARGAVEVAASVSHELVLLRPGQTAVVSSSGRDLSVLGRHASAAEGQHPVERASAEAGVAAGATTGAPRITRTLGELHPNIADLTNGLVAGGGDAHPGANARQHASLERAAGVASDAASSSAGDNGAATAATAADGNSLPGAALTNPVGSNSAASGNSNAAGGNSNAAAGTSNAGGGSANAGGGNAVAVAGSSSAAGGNPNAAVGNPTAGGGTANSAGPNAVANAAAAKAKGKSRP